MNRTKNFRRRAEGTDEDETNADDSENTVIKPSALASKTLKKDKSRKPANPKPLLSFSEDAEDDSDSRPSVKSKSATKSSRQPMQNLLSFQDSGDIPATHKTKKKETVGVGLGSGHKLIQAKDRATTVPLPSNVQPQAGEYTEEKLLELKKNTKSLGGSKQHLFSRPMNSSSDNTFVVMKGLVKPTAEENVIEETKNLEITKEEEELEEGFPDQATIDQIRAKRERMRQARAAPDYIALDSSPSGFVSSARVVSERDDSSDDELETRGRLAMSGDKMKPKPEIIRTESIEDDDEDDVEKRWEEEQCRKGLGKRIDDGSSLSATIATPVSAVGSLHGTGAVTGAYLGTDYCGAALGPILVGNSATSINVTAEALTLSQQAGVAAKSLEESFQRLKENHGKTQSDLQRADENLSQSLANITELERSLTAASEKYIYMQKLRSFISILCDFLQDKAPYIEELEEQMQTLHEERATAVVQRRVADDADEMGEVETAIKEAMSILNKGGSIATATAAAQSAILAAKEGLNMLPQLDEFGRDLNLKKNADLKRRAEARKQRRDRATVKKALSAEIGNVQQRIEGESSSDESDTDYKAYESTKNELLQTAKQVFSDAADEYSQLSFVKEKFEGWKKLYSSAYTDAYMHLSAPAIFSPYVRLELLEWDPLYEDADLDKMKWHTLLFDYGMGDNASDFDPDDVDANLVPVLVEKIVLPILHHEVEHCWDRLSTKLTKNAVSAVQVILNYVPPSNEALGELLATVRMRLAEAVSDLQVPCWSILEMNAVPQAARIAAYKFGMSVRLLKNIAVWKDILAMPVLEQLALDELLCRKMLPHLRNIVQNIHDAVTRTERVIAALSGVWAGLNHTGDLSPKLLPLVNYIVTLGKELEKKQSLGVSAEDISGLARRLKKMLVELNEYDKARRILKTFQLKEAL